MLDILAIADDLTGALETGAILAEEGFRCTVSIDDRIPDGTDAAVVNAATRHAEQDAARSIVLRLAANARMRGIEHIYLKTDSTLRGRIAESMDALLSVFPDRTILYVPAYPAMGRSVRDGRLLVRGIPVSQTEFAGDGLNPVSESSIPRLLGNLARVSILDGESDEDLKAAARELNHREKRYLAAGTAGFVRHWARALPGAHRETTPPRITARSGVIAVGSRHPRSRAQASRFQAHGGWNLLMTPNDSDGGPLAFADRFAEDVARALRQNEADSLIVFGGDTATAILKALGCREAFPLGELLPGVPASQIEVLGRPVILVSKAGGFGDEDALDRIVGLLENK